MNSPLSSALSPSAHGAHPTTLVIKRVFHAPLALAWRAWTDAQQLACWWGPHLFTNPVCELDVRPGGAWRIVMRTPDGTDLPLCGTYTEVRHHERLALDMDISGLPPVWQALLDEFRGSPATDPGRTIAVTVDLSEEDGATTLILQQRFHGVAEREAHVRIGNLQGWGQGLDRLEELLLKGRVRND